MSLRICLVSQEYPPGRVGGIGTQCRVKAHALAALGHEVQVLTAGEESGPWLTSRDEEGVLVHELRIPGGEHPVYQTETYWLGYTWTVLGALRCLAERTPFDVIDFPDYAAEGFAFQLDRQDDDPTAVVVHLHGPLSMFAEQIGWPDPSERLHTVGTFMEDLSIASADRLIAASMSIAQLTALRSGIPLELIDVVEGAVDTQMFAPARRSAPVDGELRLVFVGNLAGNKGALTVIDAFTQLAPEHPGLSLTIAGTGEEEIIEQVSERARSPALRERLRPLGFVEHHDLPDVYRSADILVAPSQYEGGLGMVYLEAMACGLPVVATAAGGAREAIARGETGILLDQGDVGELVAAVEVLIADAPMRERMGAAGRARVERRFGVERYGARVAAAYERAIERRRASVVTW
jgi:glycosyltransferase involved in cell wall biosynthesis